MREPRIGQPVICDVGVGVVAAIAAGSAGTDIHRYRIADGSADCWRYLDELILVDQPQAQR